jgi:hypothetical protein
MSRELPERERLRRRNTAVVMAFAAVVCVVGLFLAFDTLGRVTDQAADELVPQTTQPSIPATPGGDAPPADGAADPAPAPPPPPPATLFVSPSGNIWCAISEAGARCDIAEKTWDAGAPPDSCTLPVWGPGVVVDGNGPKIVCGNGSLVGGGGGTLEYGRDVTVGDFVCASSEAGMRCLQSSSGRGFSLSRRAYTFF